MKPRTYFRLAILFPYILWIICALTVAMLSPMESLSSAWDTFLMPVFFYAFGILLWFVPYTILAIGLWFWSRDKSTAALYKAGMIAPLLLLPLMSIEAFVLSLPVDNVVELGSSTISQSLFLGGFSLVFGYLIVGSAWGIYKILQMKKLILDAIPSTEQEVPAI